jgi:hypothetical protein
MFVAFEGQNKNRPRGEHVGTVRSPPESWQKKLCNEDRTRSMSHPMGSALSMSLMRCPSASVSRSASGPFEGVSHVD